MRFLMFAHYPSRLMCEAIRPGGMCKVAHGTIACGTALLRCTALRSFGVSAGLPCPVCETYRHAPSDTRVCGRVIDLDVTNGKEIHVLKHKET